MNTTGLLIRITDAGRAALVSPGNVGTNAVEVTGIGIGTEPFAFDPGMKAMPGELKRITSFGGQNVAPDTIHVTMQDATEDQYPMYAFGLYLGTGVLFAVYVQATPIMEKSSAAMLLLSTDIQFATIDATQLVFGDVSFLNPQATTEVLGVVKLATHDDARTGADNLRALTPAGLRAFGFQFGGVTTLSADTSLARAHVGRKIQWTGADGGRLRLPAGNSLWDGATYYLHNAGRGILIVSLQSDDDWFWTPARATQLALQRGDTAIIAARGNSEFDLSGGSLAIRLQERLILDGRLLVGTEVDDGRSALQVNGLVTANTPAAGDVSRNVATTEFVATAIMNAQIGQIVFEPRSAVRAGYLKANGAALLRVDYPALWAYAQASGAIVSDAAWLAGSYGCFSAGDGATTFRIPELRGEFLRCWDDGRGADAGRGVGTWQDTQNLSHAHEANASGAGDHVHSGWTDSQGWHEHDTYDIGHDHGVQPAAGVSGTSFMGPSAPPGGAGQARTSSTLSNILILGNGAHIHNVGIGNGGAHVHEISVTPDGGGEARPRNVALVAMIRAY